MKNKTLLLSFLLLVSATSFGQIYIRDVTVVDVINKKLITNQTVLISGDVISAIRPTGAIIVPSNAQVIDAEGKFLIPGLTDAHIHFFQSGGLYTRPDVIDLRTVKSYESEIAWTKNNLEDFMKRYLQAGITSVVDVGSTLNFLELRDGLSKKDFAPAIYMSGPLLTTWVPDPYLSLKDDSPFELPTSPAEAREIVRKQLAHRPNFIKIWYVVDSRNLEASAQKHLPMVKAVIDEAHKHKLKVAVHATERLTAQLAVENGADFLVHSVEDEKVSDDFALLLKTRKTILCPTLTVIGAYSKTLGQQNNFSLYELSRSNPEQIGSLEDLKHLPDPLIPVIKNAVNSGASVDKESKAHAIRMFNLKKLADNGVLIAAGTDAGNIGTQHATSYLAELKAMQESGLTQWQVLESATINAAKLVDQEKINGSVSVGKKANLVLLNANPISDINNIIDINLVFHKGSVFDPRSLIKETPLALVQRQLNAYNSRNIDAFLEPYSDDVEVYEFPDKLMYKGKETMRQNYSGMFTRLVDLHCEISDRTVNGNVIIDEEIVSGVGKDKVKATAIYHISNDKISKVFFKKK